MSVSATSFFYNFTNLQNPESILDYADDNFVEPYIQFIGKGVVQHPSVVRLTAPLIGVSVGLSMLAVSVANLVEGIFKGIANFLIGVCTLDKSRIVDSLKGSIAALGVVGAVICIAAIHATIGSVGLIIAPKWTYDHIINR